MKSNLHLSATLMVISTLLALTGCEDSGSPTYPGNGNGNGDEVSWSNDLQPIFNANCTNCHGNSLQQRELNLASYQTAMAGGQSGAVIIAGDPDNSIIIQRLESNDPAFRMPQGGSPLPQQQIDKIREWIEDGAQDN